MKPDTAMILAAGRGVRFRPLTDTIPKPLIEVAGKPLIDWQLDLLKASGVSNVVVNVSYLGELLTAHLAKRPGQKIFISPEETPLETGGGIAHALPLLGNAPFYALNSDVITLDGTESTLTRLADQWKEPMDALLLLVPLEKALGYTGSGDFFLEADGLLRRKREGEKAPYVFGGTQILHPRLFNAPPKGAFSLNLLYDRSKDAAGTLQRIGGVVHAGEWLHVGDIAGKALAEERLKNRYSHLNK